MKQLTIAFFLPLTFALSTAQASVAKFTDVKGDVRITAPGGTEAKAAVGQAVGAGSEIRAAKKSAAELVFTNGSVLKIRPNTSMRLSKNKRHKAKQKSSIVLFFGRLWSKVAGSRGDREYEISTANAVCGVRGTEFETAVADDGSVRVRVQEGTVAVAGEQGEQPVGQGEQVDANEDGVNESMTAEEKAKWELWRKRKAERLRKGGKAIVDKIKNKIMNKKERLEALRQQQKTLEEKRKSAEEKARMGDSDAIAQIRQYNEQLAAIADEIADLGDVAESQFGLVDHFADLANDPRFRMVDRKYLVAEAESLRRIKAMLDKMVQEGTDISMEAMDKMLDEMGSGKTGTLKEKSGSSVKDLFGDDMKP